MDVPSNLGGDTDTDNENDVTHSVGHTYITFVVHTIRMFQNITSLCLKCTYGMHMQ